MVLSLNCNGDILVFNGRQSCASIMNPVDRHGFILYMYPAPCMEECPSQQNEHAIYLIEIWVCHANAVCNLLYIPLSL